MNSRKKGGSTQEAKLVTSEKYIYEQAHFSLGKIKSAHLQAGDFFEVLKTDAIWDIPQNTERWEKAFISLKNAG